jgi:zinc transport system substrate-binding protein
VRRLAPLLLLLPLLTAGCSSDGAGSTPTVVVGAYPFEWLVTQLVGDDVRVVDLVKPGVEPHDVELTPRQVAEVKGADVVFYLKGFQPAVDDAVEGAHGNDLGEKITQLRSDGDALDPHVWLDPVLMTRLAAAMTTELVDELGPDGGQPGFMARYLRLRPRLDALDADIRGQLEDCRTREVVTSHAAFAYFAQRYGLTQRGITGLSPESEPSPKRLAEVADYAREHHVGTIFFESLVSPKVAETVASEVGAKTAVLDPIESVSGTDDYLSVMRRNAATLHTALGCS